MMNCLFKIKSIKKLVILLIFASISGILLCTVEYGLLFVKLYHRSFKSDNQFSTFITAPNIEFLKAFKSPCYTQTGNRFAVKNIQYQTSINEQNNSSLYQIDLLRGVIVEDKTICESTDSCLIHCLPYFMFIGFTETDTMDFYKMIKSHPLIYPAVHRDIFYWKESKYSQDRKILVEDYSDLFDYSVKHFLPYPQMDETGRKKYPYMLGDFSGNGVFTEDLFWHKHPANRGLKDPKHLKVHELRDMLPDIKIIAMLRNPTQIFYENFFRYRACYNDISSEDFHEHVLKSINWWKKCTSNKHNSERGCAYRPPSDVLPFVCILTMKGGNETHKNQTSTKPILSNYTGELVKGLYSIFIKDWYKTFSAKQILIIKAEEYTENPRKLLNNITLPFLHTTNILREDLAILKSGPESNDMKRQPMLPHTKKILDDFYNPFNKQLASFLGNEKWLWT